jgi:hypothetical protein
MHESRSPFSIRPGKRLRFLGANGRRISACRDIARVGEPSARRSTITHDANLKGTINSTTEYAAAQNMTPSHATTHLSNG